MTDKIIRISQNELVIVLTRKEAADVIALLAGQLAGAPVAGAMGGACPEVRFAENGTLSKIIFSVAPEYPVEGGGV